jgi:predicted Zn-dependent protease
VLYAAALSSVALRDASAARALHGQLLPLVAGNAPAARLAKLLGSEIELAAGDPARAGALIDPDSAGRPELLLLAQARVRAGQPAPLADMADRLQTWVAARPRDAGAWQALATVYQARGQGVRGIRAEAEAQVALMDYAAAIDRFKAAQDMTRRGGSGAVPGDHIEASIIDTRLRQIESLLREQALER